MPTQQVSDLWGSVIISGLPRERMPIRMRRPVRTYIRADQPARCANHAGTQGPHRGLVREPVGIHDSAVIAPARGTVNEKIAAAVTANMTKGDGLEGLDLVRRHSNPARNVLGALHG